MRLCETPWGAWIDASRLVAIDLEKMDGEWYVKVVLASSWMSEEVWSRPHETQRDAKACADALVLGMEPDAFTQSPYRTPKGSK